MKRKNYETLDTLNSEPVDKKESLERFSQSLSSSKAYHNRLTASALMGRWIGWAFIAVLGVCVGVWSIWDYDRESSKIHQTMIAVSDLRAETQAVGNGAILLSEGGEVDPEEWLSRIKKVNSLIGALRSGYFDSKVGIEIKSLSEDSRFGLSGLLDSLNNLERASREMVNEVSVLRSAAEAEKNLPEIIVEAQKLGDDVAVRPILAIGGGEEIISRARAEIRRPEIATLPVVFAPLPGSESIKQQWVNLFQNQANALSKWNQAQKRRWPTEDAIVFEEFTQKVNELSQALSVLSSSQSLRLKARNVQPAILKSIADADKATNQIMAALSEDRAGLYWKIWLAGLGLILIMVGLGGLGWAAISLGQDSWQASEESKTASETQYLWDKFFRKLKRSLNRDGSLVPGARLEEEARSPFYPIATLMNRTFEHVESQQKEIEQHSEDLNSVAQDAIKVATNASRSSERQSKELVSINQTLQAIAESLAVLGNKNQIIKEDSEEAFEKERQITSALQEALFRAEALREYIQETAKRLKRLGESMQSMSGFTDAFGGIGQKIQVLSMNLGIEAASNGANSETSRSFALMAQELQRLGEQAGNTVAKIESQINNIQVETQQTLATMENGTSEVVSTETTLRRIHGMLKDLDKTLQKVVSESDKTHKETEKQTIQTVNVVKRSEEWKDLTEQIYMENVTTLTAVERIMDILRILKRLVNKSSNN